jgi:hypothetical protein
VGDLKAHLAQYPDDLALVVQAYERTSCCNQENCYCSHDQKEFEVSYSGVSPKQEEKPWKNRWNYGQKAMPERVVLHLND